MDPDVVNAPPRRSHRLLGNEPEYYHPLVNMKRRWGNSDLSDDELADTKLAPRDEYDLGFVACTFLLIYLTFVIVAYYPLTKSHPL
jgi:hypothetical protein